MHFRHRRHVPSVAFTMLLSHDVVVPPDKSRVLLRRCMAIRSTACNCLSSFTVPGAPRHISAMIRIMYVP